MAASNPPQSQAETSQSPPSCDHSAWVVQTLLKMNTIKAGMTREALLKVFTIEGGISTRLRRTFVSRSCPYFKVDVQFQAVDHPNRESDGRVTIIEDGRDVIVKISTPYLQFAIAD